MKIKDRWIYQERRTTQPWVIYIRARKEGRSCRADATVYCEWAGNESGKFNIAGVSIVSNTQEAFLQAMNQFCDARGHPLRKGDKTLIRTELNELKRSMS